MGQNNSSSTYITVTGPHVDPRTVRPSDTSVTGTTGQVVNAKQRISYNYPSPLNNAKAHIANLDADEIANLKAQLYVAGYFKRSEMWQNPYTIENGVMQFLPERNSSLIAALNRAYQDANNNGVTYEELSLTRQNEISSSIRGSFWGETAAQSAAKDSTGKDSSSSTFTSYLTTRDKSDSTLDKQFKDIFGRVATKKEKDDFYKILNKKQTDPKNASKYTTKVVNGKTYVTQTDAAISVEDEVLDFAISKVNFADTKNLGTGKAREIVTNLKATASDYGMALSKKDIVKYATGIINGEVQEKSLNDVFANYAKNHYKAYADQISAEKSVKDIAASYINRKAQILEMDPDSLGIKDVEKALIGDKPMDYQQFDDMVRSDPRYQNTTQSKNNALNFATSIARAFGYGV